MLQNLKVDMVYYKTNTDFEMEFNLCGCCRMRLLNDKVSEPKTFVASLARAVSRSRIIITVGPIRGENSTVALVASALSANVVTADAQAYGIKEDGEIFILEDSTPLVTPAGEFGGCIIESGPQSMILLSDDKNVRKKILNSLVHPYIEELSKEKPCETCDPITKQIKDNTLRTVEAVKEMVSPSKADGDDTEQLIIEAPSVAEVKSESAPKAEAVADPLDDIFAIETEKNIKTEEAKPEPPRNTVEDILLTDDDTDEIPFRPFAAIKSAKRWQKESPQEDLPENVDKDFEEIYSSSPKSKSKPSSLNVLILIFFILLLVSIAVLCYCVFYIPAKDGVEAGAYIHDIFKTLFG